MYRVQRNGHSARPRGGITLLEVMISIGVVGLGLLGVAALIPLAHHKASQGVREDRKALMGKRAFREFRVRDMMRPGSLSIPYWTTRTASNFNPVSFELIRQSYCLDPLGVAAAASDFFPDHRLMRAESAPVPLVLPQRLTLFNTRPSERQYTAPDLMTREQAEDAFILKDELVFNRPADETLPPFQLYADVNQKRRSTGNYSWMATIVPEPSASSDRWTLSIAVFQKRQIAMTAQAVINQQPPNSRVSLLNEVVALGDLKNSRGDVKELVVRETASSNPQQVGVRHIKRGDWIILMQQQPVGQFLRWYEVTSADESEGDSDRDRILLLRGPDWIPAPLPQPLYAVYVRDVIAVYEKTIRTHESSLYAQ